MPTTSETTSSKATESSGKARQKPAGGFERGIDSLWNTLKSMKFAIIILLILTVASIFNLFANEFIEPVNGGAGQARAVYGEAYKGVVADLLMVFQMYDPYRSWWYTLLLAVLTLSLLVCIIDRAPGIWKRSFTPPFIRDPGVLASQQLSAEIEGDPGLADKLIALLRKKGYKVRYEHDKENNVTCAGALKFGWAQLGSWFVHVGFVVLIIGGAMIARGTYITNTSGLPGQLLYPGQAVWGFDVRVDDFIIEYYPLQEEQWVEIDGESIGRITRANDDSTFEVEVVFPVEENLTRVPAERISNRIERKNRGSRLDQMNIADYVAILTVLEDRKEMFTRRVEVNHPLRYKGYRFYQSSFDDEHTDAKGTWTTILRVRKDRGAPFVWSGILMVSLGMMVAMYFSPRQISARIVQSGDRSRMLVAARETHGRQLVEDEFKALLGDLKREDRKPSE